VNARDSKFDSQNRFKFSSSTVTPMMCSLVRFLFCCNTANSNRSRYQWHKWRCIHRGGYSSGDGFFYPSTQCDYRRLIYYLYYYIATYCTFASCRTLLFHFHFSFRLLCGLLMFLKKFLVFSTLCRFLNFKL
jgi:hypothetical protein